LRLQMGPWLAVEIPALVAAGRCARARKSPAPAQPLLTCACPAGSHTRTRRRLRERLRLHSESSLLACPRCEAAQVID